MHLETTVRCQRLWGQGQKNVIPWQWRQFKTNASWPRLASCRSDHPSCREPASLPGHTMEHPRQCAAPDKSLQLYEPRSVKWRVQRTCPTSPSRKTKSIDVSCPNGVQIILRSDHLQTGILCGRSLLTRGWLVLRPLWTPSQLHTALASPRTGWPSHCRAGTCCPLGFL